MCRVKTTSKKKKSGAIFMCLQPQKTLREMFKPTVVEERKKEKKKISHKSKFDEGVEGSFKNIYISKSEVV